MLHAALIGFPSTGKTTLFQLMTSAKDSPRGGGKTETAIGISKVPDTRLDRLTAIYNPRKHVPATIEFTDIVAPGKSGNCANAASGDSHAQPQATHRAAARATRPVVPIACP